MKDIIEIVKHLEDSSLLPEAVKISNISFLYVQSNLIRNISK